MTDHELQLKAVTLRRAAVVASAILADVEPGFQPGGKKRRVCEAVRNPVVRLKSRRPSGRQDAALYGRQGCPPLHPRRDFKPLEFERFGNCGGFAIIKRQAAVLIPSNTTGLEMATS